jgi:pilus assembly protein CpaF
VSSISAARYDDLTGTRDGRQQAFPPGFSMALTFELDQQLLCASYGSPIGDEVVLDRELKDGSRLSLVRGDISPHGPLMNIRKPRKIASNLDDLVRRGAISRGMATFLGQCVAGHLNMLVVGPPDEGAHIVLSALCAAASRERIVAVTDFDDVTAQSEGAVRLNLSHYHDEPRRLLEIASGIPQTRLAVTLNSPAFAAAILEATGTGMSGLLAALQAANLSRGLVRLPADVVAERTGMSLEAASGWVLSAFDVVIEVTRLRDGRVRVLRIGELNSDGAGGIRVDEIFRFSVSRVAAGGAVEGSFVPSGHTPRVAGQLQALGMRVDSSLFVRSTARSS